MREGLSVLVKQLAFSRFFAANSGIVPSFLVQKPSDNPKDKLRQQFQRSILK
jgi:hypothetical protein